MADYIDREKAKHIIDSELGCYDTTELEEMLSYFPREDVTPVVHGKWIVDDMGFQTCSNCGEEHNWGEYRAAYCEDCGAKMDLEDVK